MKTRTAYYSRNDSYSRSANAEAAEEDGRLPRSRAAASLGLSLAAFDAGSRAIGYTPTEWHHVGKCANRVDYFDVPKIQDDPRFWEAAADSYKTAARRAMVRSRAAAITAARRADIRARLRSQWLSAVPVVRHSGENRWRQHVCRWLHEAGLHHTSAYEWRVGDVAAVRAAIAKRLAEEAADWADFRRQLTGSETSIGRSLSQTEYDSLSGRAKRLLSQAVWGSGIWGTRADREKIAANLRDRIITGNKTNKTYELAEAAEACGIILFTD